MSIAYQCWEMGVGSTVGVGIKSHSLPQYHHVHAVSSSENNNNHSSSLRCHSSPSRETSFVMFMQQTSSDLKQQQQQQQKPVSTTSTLPISATSTLTTEEAATTATMGEAESRPLVRLGKASKPGVVEHIVSVEAHHAKYQAYGSISSESSSSICQASEDSGSCSSGDNTGGEEAQSAYRGPLTTMMSALDESLPIKRPGLSKFFGGKSRSFSSLAEVSSVNELAKPNNPYAKRRKMGFNCPLGDKTRSYPPPTRSSGASIAKKLPSHGSRNTLAVAVILGGLQQDSEGTGAQQVSSEKPPVPSGSIRAFPSRSYSLTDLPHHAGSPPRRPLARP